MKKKTLIAVLTGLVLLLICVCAAQAEAAVTAFSKTGLSVVNGKLCITYSEE